MLDFLGLAPHGAETSTKPGPGASECPLEQINVVAKGTPVKQFLRTAHEPGDAVPDVGLGFGVGARAGGRTCGPLKRDFGLSGHVPISQLCHPDQNRSSQSDDLWS
jgi:hypothetical protein